MRTKSAGSYIAGHYLMTNLGYFGMLSTLVVTLNAAAFEAAEIAVLVMVFTITNKIAKMPLAPWLDRIAPAVSVLLGCLMAAAGFLGLSIAVGLGSTVLSLVLAGAGISVNALASKQLAAAESDRAGSRVRLFSLINISINVAAAVAAPAALLLVERGHPDAVLVLVAACYTTAGIVSSVHYRRVRAGERGATAASPRAYVGLLRLPGMHAFLVVNFFGWLLYGQLFNVLALHVSRTLASPARLGLLYTLNAVLVVCLQWGVTRLTERLHGGQQLVTVVLAYTVFALSFLVASVVPGYGGAVALVAVFTLAEMMFVPGVDVLLLGLIGRDNRAVGYSLLSISTALGEATGGGLGVVVYRWLADLGHADRFWLLAAALALVFAAVTRRLRRSSAGLRALGTERTTTVRTA